MPERYKFGFPYLTDYRKVSTVDFALKHNGIYSLSIMSALPKYIEAIIGTRNNYVLYSNLI